MQLFSKQQQVGKLPYMCPHRDFESSEWGTFLRGLQFNRLVQNPPHLVKTGPHSAIQHAIAIQ